jgi:hypothetical protein
MVSQSFRTGTNDVNETYTTRLHPIVAAFPSRVRPRQRSTEAITRIYDTDASDIQKVGAANLNLNDLYCESIINQANRSFWSALIAAMVGLLFFLGAVAFIVLSHQNAEQLSLVTGLGTAITACVSGTSFYLYRSTMKHFEAFHLCLARTEIVLLENSVCKQIEDVNKRDAAYADVVENIEHLAVLLTTGQSSKKNSAMNGNKEEAK